jgi:hypothetical protein
MLATHPESNRIYTAYLQEKCAEEVFIHAKIATTIGMTKKACSLDSSGSGLRKS